MAWLISASTRVKTSDISPISSQRSPMVPLTTDSSTPRLANPIPAPYSDLARAKASLSCGVGIMAPSLDRLENRLQGAGGDFALVWDNRDRAALAKAFARFWDPVESKFRVMARKLFDDGVRKILERKYILEGLSLPLWRWQWKCLPSDCCQTCKDGEQKDGEICDLHMTESLSDVVRTNRGSWCRHLWGTFVRWKLKSEIYSDNWPSLDLNQFAWISK